MRNLRVLIVDDEPLARRGLSVMLAQLPGVELVGQASEGRKAVELCSRLRPDVVLLDISMPEMDGFETLEAMASDGPVVVFVTAFGHHAIRAFDVGAADYVLKPVAFDRLRAAIEKARVAVEHTSTKQRVAELAAIVAALRESVTPAAPKRFVSEVWIPQRGEQLRVPVASIERIEAEREYVHVVTAKGSHLLRQSISHFEDILDPELFVRLRRSAIVRRDRIVAVKQAGYGSLAVELSDGVTIRVGRTFVDRVRKLIDATT